MNAPVATEEELIVRRAPSVIEPASFNAVARTVIAVISTGAPAARFDFMGEYDEILTISGRAVDLSRIRGAPVLDNHQRAGVNNILGVVEDAWIENGRLLGRLKFSGRADVAGVVTDVSDGVIKQISAGYTVQKFEERREANNGRRTKTATRWTPLEVSIVPVSVDPGAFIRKEQHMEPNAAAGDPSPPAIVPGTPPAGLPTDQQAAAIAARAAINLEIRSIGRLAGLDQSWIDGQIDAGATADSARSVAFEAMRQRSAPAAGLRNANISIGVDHSDPEIRVRTIGEALYARVTPGHQLSEPARPYAYMSCLDIARDSLRQRSMPITGLAPAQIIERALHTTSDFPLILGDAIGRTLRQGYTAVPSGLKRVARPTTNKDFRDKHRLQLSEAPKLEKVNEHGEFKSGTMAEGKETYRLVTYGRIIGFTRQAIVNDDLGAFTDLARRFGQAAASHEAQVLVDLITANAGNGPAMSDGKTLFHVDHKNKASGADVGTFSGANPPLVAVLLGTARTAMRKQVGLSGELITVDPKFLIVPAELETLAEQALANIAPTKSTDFNPFAGVLSLVVEPRLTSAVRWYVSGDPASLDGLEYAYLEGEEGVQTFTEQGFDVDGVRVKARLDFGAGFVEWRSFYMNPGA